MKTGKAWITVAVMTGTLFTLSVLPRRCGRQQAGSNGAGGPHRLVRGPDGTGQSGEPR